MSSVQRSDGQLISSTMRPVASALAPVAVDHGRTSLLISVVMVARNSALDRTIESVLAQSESSWELVIVNDGSTDGTAAAASWASRDRRIRVVNQSNTGASHACSRGISEARGHWIVFLDSDDILDRCHFELMLKAVRSPPWDHANGLQREPPQKDLLVGVMFSSATRLDAGQSPPCRVFDSLEPFHPLRPLPTPRAIAALICAGLAMRSQGGRQRVAAHWSHFSANLWVFLQAFEAWAQTRGIAIAVLYEVELECLRSVRFRGSVTLTHTIGVDLMSLSPLDRVSGGPTTDRLVVFARTRKSAKVVANIPFFGPMRGAQIQAAVFRRMFRRAERKALGVGFLPSCLGRVGLLSAAVHRTASALGVRRPTTRELPGLLAVIVEEEKRKIETSAIAVKAAPTVSTHPEEQTAAGWDRLYEHEDPWDYGSRYEQQKYEDTLELIPSVKGAALEIACSEGRFTERLAPKAERLLAVDISANALARAGRRCSRFSNVEFKQIDVFQQELSGTWSLIVCSEMLYYLPDKASLRILIDKLFRATEPGGYFVHAHARSLYDDTTRSGFDWGVPFGGDFVADVLSQAGFQRLRTIDREVYRIDLFQKPPVSLPAAGAETVSRTVSGMPPRVAGGVVWRGAIQTRAKLDTVRRLQVPVLAYHRIANSGPDFLAPYRVTPEQFEEQLIFLRRRGYRSCSPAEMAAGAERSGSLRGRRVVITFDDGYTDFYETAWPILQRNGFSAHNFIVTEQVGGHADWDARWGAPAPLMTWDQIVRLSAEGVTFGSHLATHTAATHLRSETLFREAVNSRLRLEQVLGVPIDTIATPFGQSSGLVELLLREAGYRQHYGNHMDCFAPVSSNWMSIPRLFVTSDLDIHAFGRLMRLAHEPPEAADRLPVTKLAS